MANTPPGYTWVYAQGGHSRHILQQGTRICGARPRLGGWRGLEPHERATCARRRACGNCVALVPEARDWEVAV